MQDAYSTHLIFFNIYLFFYILLTQIYSFFMAALILTSWFPPNQFTPIGYVLFLTNLIKLVWD